MKTQDILDFFRVFRAFEIRFFNSAKSGRRDKCRPGLPGRRAKRGGDAYEEKGIRKGKGCSCPIYRA